MNPLNIQSGWWVSTDERFVRCYNTREEAISHVKYQQDVMHSTANWNTLKSHLKNRKVSSTIPQNDNSY